MSLECLPTDCFNGVCLYLELKDISNLAACNKNLVALCANEKLWKLLVCQRTWRAVDPATADDVDWRALYHIHIMGSLMLSREQFRLMSLGKGAL